MRGKELKTKVTPLLARLFETPDISNIPAIKWGRLHEKDAGAAFFSEEGKQHANPNMHACGLFLCKSHPYLGATPDSNFTCSCCGPSCTDYKCPCSIKDFSIDEGWEKTDFLEEVDQKVQLKRSHKYYFQVQGQKWE